MGFQFLPGKYPKQAFTEKIYQIRLNNGNGMKFIAILQKAGYVEMKGTKMILIKKPLKF